jgi:hypothetical protein
MREPNTSAKSGDSVNTLINTVATAAPIEHIKALDGGSPEMALLKILCGYAIWGASCT